jgi:hypothetical protein
MVKAKKGKNIIKVSKKSYERMFKDNGYVLIDEHAENVPDEYESENNEEPIYTPEHEEHEEEETEVNIDEIPISEMNSKQLREFAIKHNIDTKSARSVKDARKIVQEAVKEMNM